MLINYAQIPKEKRDTVRAVNDKGHAPYVISLMLKRFPIEDIQRELLKLNLSGNATEQYKTFYKYALLPRIKEVGLDHHYKVYTRKYKDTSLSIVSAFAKDEEERFRFIRDLIVPTGAGVFFFDEIRRFYGGILPKDEQGKPIIKSYGTNWLEILTHEKRHAIDNFLLEGRTPKEIVDYFGQIHNEVLGEMAIESYAEGFMNAKLHNMTKVIEDMEKQLTELSKSIALVKEDEQLELGEKSVIITNLKKQERMLRDKVKKIKSLHNSGAFSTATLEIINMRDILSDILNRSYRRFKMMDTRTDDDVVVNLARLAGVIGKATTQILQLDVVSSSVETKSITDEMLEVISPTLDRLEKEEQEAANAYSRMINQINGIKEDEVDEETEEEIIGL